MPSSPSTRAVDGERCSTLMLALALTRPDLIQLHVVAQPDDAVRIEAGQIGFDHLLRGKLRIGGGHAAGQQRIARERDHRRDGETTGLGHPCYAAAARAVTGKYFSSQS